MTRALYHEDPYLTQFTAQAVRTEPADRKNISKSSGNDVYAVVLDRTAFYPEGGGQPADIGRIAGLPVVDVRKVDGEVVHYVDASTAAGDAAGDAAPGAGGNAALGAARDEHPTGDTSRGSESPGTLEAGAAVTAEVDWGHRFDYMQQHTGQHVISAAFVHTGDYPTVSVHQGEEYTTIEIDVEQIPDADLDAVEERANEIVAANAAVRAYIVSEDQVPELQLRRPPKVSGDIRIVEIEGFDRVACGGVHLARTAEVGWVKLVGTERIRGRVRTIWKIGRRALADYRLKTRITAELTDLLSVQVPEIAERTRKLVEKLAEREYELEGLKRRIATLTADALVAAAPEANGAVTGRLPEEDAETIREVAEDIVERHARPVALIAPQRERMRWCVGIPRDVDIDFNASKSDVLAPIAGKGGGKAPYWQGVAENADSAEEFFEMFRELVRRAEG
jgi:alanyl-tRNA synthetase